MSVNDSDILIIHAPTWRHARVLSADITVEAEYGNDVAKGTVYTAAHHQPSGPFAGRHIVAGGRPSPCNDPRIPVLDEGGTILVSHMDLDTIGGVLRAVPETADLFRETTFWDVAEYADTQGAHLLHRGNLREQDVTRFWSFIGWSRTQPRLPLDVPSFANTTVHAAHTALEGILADDPTMLAMGETIQQHDAKMAAATFVHATDGVMLRHLDDPSGFVNHLYVGPNGAEHAAIVTWNRTTGAITVSVAEPDKHPHANCRDIVQLLWGPAAGGHPGCAGSPRGERLGFGEADRAVRMVQEKLVRKQYRVRQG